MQAMTSNAAKTLTAKLRKVEFESNWLKRENAPRVKKMHRENQKNIDSIG
jgi:hypothetical protein